MVGPVEKFPYVLAVVKTCILHGYVVGTFGNLPISAFDVTGTLETQILGWFIINGKRWKRTAQIQKRGKTADL